MLSLDIMMFREESDSLGTLNIPQDKMWGSQTQRAIKNFPIGGSAERMPLQIIYALALIKKCAALTHLKLSLLEEKKAKAIAQAATEVQAGKWDKHFPLPVWQTGSGTGTNMNVNEVIANRAIQLTGGQPGDKSIHPNDDVNKCQSSNDVFPTAMHIAAVKEIHTKLLPSLKNLKAALGEKVKDFSHLIKMGRTHMMDATPLTLGQEFSAYTEQLLSDEERLKNNLQKLYLLPLGGSAVGTGLNTDPQFAPQAMALIAKESGYPFRPAPNKFALMAAHDDLVELSGVLKTLSCTLMKTGSDIRLMASGPRAGLNEVHIPANEPGSSIMPGKVNPTQCEALTMICTEVMGCDSTVGLAGSQGHFQLNVFKPVLIFNILRAIRLLSDGMHSFTEFCIKGLKANKVQLQQYKDSSLMLVTALNPYIGYDKAAQIAKAAYQNGTTLKEEALKSGFITEKEFDRIVQPENMTGPTLLSKKT